ncbi:MAG TPA: hypothetical protein VFP30_02400 [Candidatus Limnocylindria bacterium]|nr:hypothetical protein [Candidatus Limnocylindria bacterium]
MTTEGTFTPATEAEPPALYCYRHPDRETWVRCGRCDQPICSRCAMQGPVGFRCRECGRPARDPLTSLRPSQLAIGLGISVLGGIVVGLFSTRIGFFGLLLAWLLGGVIADAVIRLIGFKRGPRMMAALFGGILVGAAVVFVGEATAVAGTLGPEGRFVIAYVYSQGPWAALAAAIACFGAWSRFRF